ncbi:ABC transporter ATP-binding protein [Salinarimonas ramus]|uniref:ABC transporter n=1 Tax=Salinarimonas ramus TaxID=690164 RepID=A0A917Q9Y7_9HYPH|nr:ABC transporter ATP-binding protein [Salinarimonas ramus]GGK37120.1 ABC transporter [Salinarimonas ramus]
MGGLELEGVTKAFGASRAVDDVSLRVEPGAFLALLGPSGCGKTTLLRLVAGLERPSAGRIAIAGRVVSDPGRFVEAEERGLGMVFQSYALWPHMSVAENVAFGLRVRKLPAEKRRRRVADALAMVGLDAFADRKPAQLSGGQRQRVALARCLALEPPLVLLDEPLANLDAHLRETMQREFRRLHRETGATFVVVTHDQAEAMALADTIAVMHEGRLQQVAPPQDLYAAPATEMVARFIGRGALLPVEILEPARQGRAPVRLAGRTLVVRSAAEAAGPGRLVLRSETLALSDAPDGVPARVVDAVYRGGFHTLDIAIDGVEGALVQVASREALASGAPVGLAIEDAWALPA